MIEALEALKNSGKVIVDEDHDWGYQLRFVNEEEYCGKFLVLINTEWGHSHFHHKKKETFIVIYGAIMIWIEGIGDKLFGVGDQITFLPNNAHNVKAGNDYIDKNAICVLMEVSTHDDDNDTYRIGGEEE